MQLVKQSDLPASRSGSASEGCMKIVQWLMNETADQPLTETTLANAPPFGEGVLACVATKDRKSMNHLLSGTALAAVLVIAAPVWAQTTAPMTPASPASAAAAPAKAAVATSTPHKRMHVHHRVYHHAANRSSHQAYRYHASNYRARPGDIAKQLNAQELRSRVGSSSVPGMAGSYGWGYDQGAAGYGQPSPTQGLPGAWQPSASSHASSGPGPQWVPGYQSSASSHPPSQMR